MDVILQMWEVSEDNIERLKGWIDDYGDESLKKSLAKLKVSKVIISIGSFRILIVEILSRFNLSRK